MNLSATSESLAESASVGVKPESPDVETRSDTSVSGPYQVQ